MDDTFKVVQIENVSKDFGGLRAVNNVSFSVDSGERVAIIGPNGAGKTTLFHLITGLLRPSKGKISISGKDVTHMPAYQRASLGVSRTFQITSLFLNLTVGENVLLSLEALSRAKLDLLRPIALHTELIVRARDSLERWGLLNKWDTLVRNLSYGEQRQLEIILALSQDAKVLLLDEPTSGLSPVETLEAVPIINSLPANIAVLIIEHDMSVAFQVANRVLVFYQGKLVASGSCDEIKQSALVKEIYMGE